MSAKKKTTPVIESDSELHKVIDHIARLEVSIRARIASRDDAVNQVLAVHDKEIELEKTVMSGLLKVAGAYSDAHRPSLFSAGMKSAASALARFGFRSGNPTLKPLNKKWTMDIVLVKLKELGKWTRTVVEIDKEAIHAAHLSDVELAEIGLRIDSGEKFFVEPKSETDRLTIDADPD